MTVGNLFSKSARKTRKRKSYGSATKDTDQAGKRRDIGQLLNHSKSKRSTNKYLSGSSSFARSHRVHASKPTLHKPSFLRRIINHWWDRLLSSIMHREFGSAVELYDTGQTTRDYIWNSIGLGTWGAEFPLLTIVVTQLVGTENAGMFSMAYVTGMMLMCIGNYGARTFQVSDVYEEQSFAAYQIQRFLTCALMAAIGWIWCLLHHYGSLMVSICIGVFGFRMMDALADVYEGRLQQQDKLYLAGLSQSIRCAGSFCTCSLVLMLTRNLGMASMALFVTSIVSFAVLSLPLALLETSKSRKPELIELREIFVQCFPPAAALFLYSVIDNMPKFAMEGMLSYDNQLYYNAIYFPAHAIIMTIGFIYKPQLVRLANVWADPSGRRRFDLIIFAILGITAATTVAVGVFMGVIGIRIMSFVYGVDFTRFTRLVYVMVISGGIAATIDFLYQIITVLRQQAAVTFLYTIGFVLSVPVSYGLVNIFGLAGAVYAALATMSVLFILLSVEYIRLRAHL